MAKPNMTQEIIDLIRGHIEIKKAEGLQVRDYLMLDFADGHSYAIDPVTLEFVDRDIDIPAPEGKAGTIWIPFSNKTEDADNG